jgi:ribonuclease VapC
MVVDTSALLAILLDEPERDAFIAAIRNASTGLISVASVVEASIVLTKRFGESQDDRVDALIARLPLQVWPIDSDQMRWARYAVETYGRGRHPAGLNFGDCFAYALAKTKSEPLLFKGGDLSHTDVAAAV